MTLIGLRSYAHTALRMSQELTEDMEVRTFQGLLLVGFGAMALKAILIATVEEGDRIRMIGATSMVGIQDATITTVETARVTAMDMTGPMVGKVST